jgi:hypothetical protein
MFTIQDDPQFTHTVKVQVPVDGGFKAQEFKATFRVVPPEETDRHDLHTTEGSTAFLRRVIVSLDDIGADGQILPYSDELRDRVLARPYARTALATTYFKAIAGARAGN